MGLSTVKYIVAETCHILWETLGPIYLPLPKRNDWNRISNDFWNMWGFPNTVGAIDGKHIRLTCPSNSGSRYFNYKGTFSIVLLAVCDANYGFTYVDIGAYGSQSDGGTLRNSTLWRELNNGNLDLPPDKVLPGSTILFPHFLIGDSAFPIKKFMMCPFKSNLTDEKRTFNMRLSRARRVIENAFGILAARWRILFSPLQMSRESAIKVVQATVVLHNFLKTHDGSYCPAEYADQLVGDNIVYGLWRQDIENPLESTHIRSSNNAPHDALALRNILTNYINEHPF